MLFRSPVCLWTSSSRGSCSPRVRSRAQWASRNVGAEASQIVATWELVGRSARADGVDPEFAGQGSLPPWEAINAVLPRAWGWERPADIAWTYMHKGAAYFGTGENHWEDCFYVGFPALVLALTVARRERVWSALAIGSLLAAGHPVLLVVDHAPEDLTLGPGHEVVRPGAAGVRRRLDHAERR